MLMWDEKLAQLRTRFDEQSGEFTIERDGQILLKAEITDPSQRGLISEFFADFLSDSVTGTPRVVEAPGHTFSDAKQKPNSTTYQYVSLVNLASIRALEQVWKTFARQSARIRWPGARSWCPRASWRWRG